MTPYTIDDAEQDMRAAIDAGDTQRINLLAAWIDEHHHQRPTATMQAAALWYAEQGLAVFRLQPRAKIPLKGSRGCKDATTDADTIRAWWTEIPDANIGLATGGRVDVVDIDGHAGQVSRANAHDSFDTLTTFGVVLTPRPGGMHLYVPATGRGNAAGVLDGIDYRGRGGYVVAPPSVTDVGSYRWLHALELTPASEVAA